jgi:hypothetical protein
MLDKEFWHTANFKKERKLAQSLKKESVYMANVHMGRWRALHFVTSIAQPSPSLRRGEPTDWQYLLTSTAVAK